MKQSGYGGKKEVATGEFLVLPAACHFANLPPCVILL